MDEMQAAGEDSPKGGGQNDKKVLNIPFEHVSRTIREELAMLMDPSGRNDWHSLAETLGFTAKQINVGVYVPYVNALQLTRHYFVSLAHSFILFFQAVFLIC